MPVKKLNFSVLRCRIYKSTNIYKFRDEISPQAGVSGIKKARHGGRAH